MTPLGRTTEQNAEQFVASHSSAVLGSKTMEGLRRVMTSAVGNELKAQRAAFAALTESVPAKPDAEPVIVTQFPECIHRGSKRHTCCGMPEMHICKLLKTDSGQSVDCVATQYDKAKLIASVGTPESQQVGCCETCKHRPTGSAAG